MLAGGTLYREQNIVLSPFDDGFTSHFSARRMFMGAHSVGRLGLMESDPLVIQGERRFMGQADELVVLADSSKFATRSSLVFCALEDIDVLVTDDGIDDASAAMLEAADVRLVVAERRSRGGAPDPRPTRRLTTPRRARRPHGPRTIPPTDQRRNAR